MGHSYLFGTYFMGQRTNHRDKRLDCKRHFYGNSFQGKAAKNAFKVIIITRILEGKPSFVRKYFTNDINNSRYALENKEQ